MYTEFGWSPLARRRSARQCMIAGFLVSLVWAPIAAGQVSYTFTSGPAGDGFNWPASPTGLLDGHTFFTPEDVEFYNNTGNNVFFDSQYQVAGNAPNISGDALWGNPLGSYVNVYLGFDPPQTVGFDLAWSVGGFPGATPDFVEVYLEDSEGRATNVFVDLGTTFTGLGGFDGYADRLHFDAADLEDDFFFFDGGPFIDIASVYIYVSDLDTGGPASEFAIDNFDLDGSELNGEIFPSVNGGTVNVSGATLGHSVLRGTGTYTSGVEVTNGSNQDTTFSTELLPGAGLSDNGQVSNMPILIGQTVWSGSIVSINKALPSGAYDGDILVVNDLFLSDPDDVVTFRVRLVESPDLTAPSPVNVSAAEPVQLSNANAPVNGFRASVKVTGTNVAGPFDVSGFELNAPVKAGEMIQGAATFDRFGRLSDDYDGAFTVSLAMTFFVGPNNDIEVFLSGAEPVPDEQWTLEATLADMLNDSTAYAAAQQLGPGLVGANSATTATTILAGAANASGTVSLFQGFALPGGTTDPISQATTSNFSTAVPVHVLQMTYNEDEVCAPIDEDDLRLLYSVGGDWHLAVNGNSDAGAGETFFAGSFADFAATLGGNPLSSALGTHGVDVNNNHVWAILDHEGTFVVAQPGQACGVPGDCDGDGDVDLFDYADFTDCFSGPGGGLGLGCDCFDFDGDGDNDLQDFAAFQLHFGN